MKKTVLAAIVMLSTQAWAGGGVSGFFDEEPLDRIVCSGDGMDLGFNVKEGTTPHMPIQGVGTNWQVHLKDPSFIAAALSAKVIEESIFLKINGLNEDLLGFAVNSVGQVNNVYGGKVGYRLTKRNTPSSGGVGFSYLGQEKLEFTDVVFQNTYGNSYKVSILHTTAEVRRCLKSEMQPNPFALDDQAALNAGIDPAEIIKEIEVCLKDEVVTPAITEEAVSQTYTLQSCIAQ